MTDTNKWNPGESKAIDDAQAEFDELKESDPMLALAVGAMTKALSALPTTVEDDIRALEWFIAQHRKIQSERDNFNGVSNATVQ